MINYKKIKKSSDRGIMAQHRGNDKIIFTVAFVIFAVHCITLMLPLLWMFLTSLKGDAEYITSTLGSTLGTSSIALPKNWEFINYIKAFSAINESGNDTSFAMMIFNSVWYTGLSVLAGLVGPSVVGYVLSKYDFIGKNLIYSVVIFSITIPIVGTTAAGMKLLVALNLYDNPLKLIVNMFAGFSGSFLVYYGFFKSVSWSYAEAAEIDGANPFVVFFKIMIPQAAPIYFTYAITSGIAAWNDYESVLLYFPSYLNIAAGLYKISPSNTIAGSTNRCTYPIYYAGMIISMIPAITIFAIFSDKIMTSISVGGLKG